MINTLGYEIKKSITSRVPLIISVISMFMGIAYIYIGQNDSDSLIKETTDSVLLSKSANAEDINEKRATYRQESNWKELALISSEWYFEKSQQLDISPKYFAFRNYYGLLDGMYSYLYTGTFYEQAVNLPKSELNQEILNRKDGIQTVFESMKSQPFQILFILYAVSLFNIYFYDTKNYSVNLLLPNQEAYILLSKFIRMIVNGVLIFISFLITVFICSSVRYGVGNIFLRIPIYQTHLRENGIQLLLNDNWFTNASLLYLLGLSVLCIFLILCFLALVTVLINLVFPANRLVILPTIFLGILGLLPKERYALISDYNRYIPWNYFNVGKLISGELKYWSGNQQLTLTNFFFLFSSIIVILSILIFMIWRYQHGEKNYIPYRYQ